MLNNKKTKRSISKINETNFFCILSVFTYNYRLLCYTGLIKTNDDYVTVIILFTH